jgi:hypothetical protein
MLFLDDLCADHLNGAAWYLGVKAPPADLPRGLFDRGA